MTPTVAGATMVASLDRREAIVTQLLNPYLSFRDTAREAITFYHSVFGGDLRIGTFGEFGMGDASDADKVMHSQLTNPSGLTIMAADTPASMELSEGASIWISLSGDDEAALRGYWDKLAEGALIELPLDTAPWGDTFGQLVDKFGVHWLVDISDGSMAPQS